MPAAWETLCKAKSEEETESEDPTVLEFIELQKENGITPIPLKQVRSTVGNDREDWRFAMQAEVDSLREHNTFEVATSEELRKVHAREILPMKLATGIKADSLTQQKKKKARAVVCGNFQRKTEGEELYTANADITSVRAVLAASVQRRFGCKVLDVKTAFLNAHLPDSFETVFVRPPQVLVEFGLVAPGTIWRAVKAIYGLRISPKAWGVERDRQLRKMSIDVDGKKYIFHQSHIDPSVWTVVRGRFIP